MTTEKQSQLPHTRRLTGPARDFTAYTEREFERRRASEEDFNADSFHQAVELVLHKLGA